MAAVFELDGGGGTGGADNPGRGPGHGRGVLQRSDCSDSVPGLRPTRGISSSKPAVLWWAPQKGRGQAEGLNFGGRHPGVPRGKHPSGKSQETGQGGSTGCKTKAARPASGLQARLPS